MSRPWADRLFVVIAALAIAGPADAYIDPGSGALLLQLVIASGIGAAIKFWRFFKGVLERVAGSLKR